MKKADNERRVSPQFVFLFKSLYSMPNLSKSWWENRLHMGLMWMHWDEYCNGRMSLAVLMKLFHIDRLGVLEHQNAVRLSLSESVCMCNRDEIPRVNWNHIFRDYSRHRLLDVMPSILWNITKFNFDFFTHQRIDCLMLSDWKLKGDTPQTVHRHRLTFQRTFK
jgi:hypothetical protein